MFDNKKEITDYIVELMENEKISMIDASIHVSDKFNIDPEVVGSYIKRSPRLKELILKEALDLRLVKE